MTLSRAPRHTARRTRAPHLIALIALVLSAGSARAQLTPDDITRLRQQAAEEGWTFTVAPNPATEVPLEDLCGFVLPDGWETLAKWDPCPPRRDLPARFDWRDVGGCTPVKNQGSCGSCWAFATLGPLECNIKIKDGLTTDLSEQWLVSCNSNNWGCDGGFWAHDYLQWRDDPCGDNGAVLEADFPYVAWDATCRCPYPHVFWIAGWAYIGSSSGVPPVASIKQAILDYGPVSVAVTANDAMQAYGGGIFNGCASGSINHAVVLVGWDDNQGSGVWFMRNSWGPGWGESGYMRIPYGCSSIGYSAAYLNYVGLGLDIAFEYPDGQPDTAQPSQPTTFRVNVLPDGGTPVPGSGRLHYARNGGSFINLQMTQLAPNEYRATLPPANCGDVYQWYVSALEATVGRRYDPQNAPASVYTTTVESPQFVFFADNFETNQGWTVGDTGDDATTGIWSRNVPQATAAQPGTDHSDPGTMCWVTDYRAGTGVGTYDIDGGKTTLKSPVFDLSDVAAASVGYWRWFSNDEGSSPSEDVFKVDISATGGSTWMNAETVGPTGAEASGGWYYHSFNIGDYIPLTSQVQLRFVASDEYSGSIVEAAVDDFQIIGYDCVPDCNTNGVDDALDVAGGTSADCNSNGVPDECDLAWGDSPDCNGNSVPDLCDVDGGTSADCNSNLVPDECDVALSDCNSNGIPDSCDVLAGSSPDCNYNLIPDDCDLAVQVSPDCNGNSVPDECDITAGTSGDCNANGTPDECDLLQGASLDCNGNSIPDECDLAAGTAQDCNENGVPDSCDLASGTSPDCNANTIPDECDLLASFAVAGPQLSPIGDGYPQTYTLVSPPVALGYVTLSFEAYGDLNFSTEYIDVDIDGTWVAAAFGAGVVTTDCPTGVPNADTAVVTPAVWNAAAADGSIQIHMVATENIDPFYCPQTTWISVAVSYAVSADDADCNSNGVPDECDLADCAGQAWCGDCNTNGVLDACDIAGGTSQDLNGDGRPDECPAAQGACCLANGSCAFTTQPGCGGTWLGDGTDCDPNPCPQPWCLGDLDCSGGAPTFDDIKYFAVALSGESAWRAYYRDRNGGADPPCPWLLGDYNNPRDGVEFADIKPFAASIGSNCAAYVPE